MKKVFIVLGMVFVMAQQLGAGGKTELKDQKDRVSYSLGIDIGRNFKKQGVDVDADLFMSGFREGISGGKGQMTDQEVQDTIMALRKEMMAKEMERSKASGEKNKKEGEQFLAENSKKDGVKTLPSGLQYKVIKAGNGPKPKATSTVEVHYRGTLINGTEFDSSYKRNQPAEFPVNEVIAGWTEALQLMPVGSKWQLFIPSKLAYGDRQAGPEIGPNSTLIFEVELLGIK